MSNGLYDIYKTSNRMDDIYKASDIGDKRDLEAFNWIQKQILVQIKINAAFRKIIADGNITYEHEHEHCSEQLTNQSDHGACESSNSTLHDVDDWALTLSIAN